jgi:hypothetical protein
LAAGLTIACGDPVSLPPVPPPTAPGQSGSPGHRDVSVQSFLAPLSVADAEYILRRTEIFAFGNMAPKRQVQAVTVLLEQPDAPERLRAIAARAGTAGKLYVLAAMLALDLDDWVSLEAELSSSQAEVNVRDSDVWEGPQAAADVVQFIRDRQLWKQMRSEKAAADRYYEKCFAGLPPPWTNAGC